MPKLFGHFGCLMQDTLPSVDVNTSPLQGIITEEAILILGVEEELRKLQKRMKQIQCFISDAERRGMEDSAAFGPCLPKTGPNLGRLVFARVQRLGLAVRCGPSTRTAGPTIEPARFTCASTWVECGPKG
uniref:Disease resistance N-terminal domain-containing protein n=1 Tax=Oryza barthii TaxID=65489 RepID=A0A0D3HPU1_9ORYZ